MIAALPALVLLAVPLAVPSLVHACEACKEAVSADPVGTALSATTLLLIAMPILLVGSIGGWVSYVYWRAARLDARQPAMAETPPSTASLAPTV